MGSDNVIRPVFGAKPVAAASIQLAVVPDSVNEGSQGRYKDIGPLTGDALVQAQRDLVYVLTHMDFANCMRDRLEKLGDLVFDLAGYTPDTRSIELRRQGLRTMTLEEICNLAANVNEVQVRMQPSYLVRLRSSTPVTWTLRSRS